MAGGFGIRGNKDERKYPLSPDLLCYVPGEQRCRKKENMYFLGLIRIAVYNIIPPLMFRLTLIGVCSAH